MTGPIALVSLRSDHPCLPDCRLVSRSQTLLVRESGYARLIVTSERVDKSTQQGQEADKEDRLQREASKYCL